MLAHLGPVRSLQAGLLAVCLALLLMAQSHLVAGLIGALLLGLGVAPNAPAGSQILLRTAPPAHRSLIFLLKQAGVPLGGALAGLVVAKLVTGLGIDLAIGIVAGAMILTLVLVQPQRKRLDAEAGPRQPGWPRLFLSVAVVFDDPRLSRAAAARCDRHRLAAQVDPVDLRPLDALALSLPYEALLHLCHHAKQRQHDMPHLAAR